MEELKSGRDLAQQEVDHINKHQSCPLCRDGKIVCGPEGGGSQNILCTNCGTEFCWFMFGGEVMPRNESRAQYYGFDKLPQNVVVDYMTTYIPEPKKPWYRRLLRTS